MSKREHSLYSHRPSPALPSENIIVWRVETPSRLLPGPHLCLKTALREAKAAGGSATRTHVREDAAVHISPEARARMIEGQRVRRAAMIED